MLSHALNEINSHMMVDVDLIKLLSLANGFGPFETAATGV